MTKLNNKFIGNEKKYLIETLKSKTSFVKKLETKFSKKSKISYSIAVNSGTSALHSALKALDVGYGDEVLIPAHTVIMPTLVTVELNAMPVFVDIDPNTFNICPINLEKKITKKTKAIIAVHMHGLPADMLAIMQIAKKNNIRVIEDAAQCLFGKINDKYVGSFGDIACYSFETKKHICGFEGGMITTNNEKFAKKARKFAGLGYQTLTGKSSLKQKLPNYFRSPEYKRHSSLGLNYRMNEPTAAVVLAQLENSSKFVNRRIKVAGLFLKAIKNCHWLIPQFVPVNYKNVYWTITLKYYGDKYLGLSWKRFLNLYSKEISESFYAGLAVVPEETVLKNIKEIKKVLPIYNKCNYCKTLKSCIDTNKPYVCTNAYLVQPRLIQLKANQRNIKEVKQKALKLEKFIKRVESKFNNKNYNVKFI